MKIKKNKKKSHSAAASIESSSLSTSTSTLSALPSEGVKKRGNSSSSALIGNEEVGSVSVVSTSTVKLKNVKAEKSEITEIGKNEKGSEGKDSRGINTNIALQSPPVANLSTKSVNSITLSKKTMKKIVTDLKNDELSTPFLYPVSVDDAPNYSDYVSEPMDLSTVEKKIKLGFYETVDGTEKFIYEIKLIWGNCILYNDPVSEIALWATSLGQKFDDILMSVYKEFAPTVPPVQGTVNIENEKEKEKEKEKVLNSLVADEGQPLKKKKIEERTQTGVTQSGVQSSSSSGAGLGLGSGLVSTVFPPTINSKPSTAATTTSISTTSSSSSFSLPSSHSNMTMDNQRLMPPIIKPHKRQDLGVIGKKCWKIAKTICKDPRSLPFQNPIDLSEAPGYLDIVERPMDINYVKRQLEIYETNPRLFLKDMILIFDNCIKYNIEGSQLAVWANELKIFLEELYYSHITAELHLLGKLVPAILTGIDSSPNRKIRNSHGSLLNKKNEMIENNNIDDNKMNNSNNSNTTNSLSNDNSNIHGIGSTSNIRNTAAVSATPWEPALAAATLRIAADVKEANTSHTSNSSSTHVNSNTTAPLSLSLSVIPLKPGQRVRSAVEVQKFLTLLESSAGLSCTEIREKGAKKARAVVDSFETPCWSTSGVYEILDFGEISNLSNGSSEKHIYSKGYRTVRSVKLCLLPTLLELSTINGVVCSVFSNSNISNGADIVESIPIIEHSGMTSNGASSIVTENELSLALKSVTKHTNTDVIPLTPKRDASYFFSTSSNAPFVAVEFTSFVSSYSSPSGDEMPLFVITVDG